MRPSVFEARIKGHFLNHGSLGLGLLAANHDLHVETITGPSAPFPVQKQAVMNTDFDLHACVQIVESAHTRILARHQSQKGCYAFVLHTHSLTLYPWTSEIEIEVYMR